MLSNNESPIPNTRHQLIFSAAFYLILAGHFAVDAYSALIPAILNKLEVQFHLKQDHSAWLLAAGSFSSGFSQPIFGWLGKRMSTVAFIGIGILFAAVFIPSISMLAGGDRLFAHYILGMIGVGIFHPIGASSIGAIDPSRRSMAISWFFVAGMAGGVSGSILGPALITNQWNLIESYSLFGKQIPPFAFLAIPGILLFLPVYFAARSIHHHRAPLHAVQNYVGGQEISPHRSMATSESTSKPDKPDRPPYFELTFLYLASATRFFVNMAVVFLMVRLAAAYFQSQIGLGNVAEIDAPDQASQLAGRLQAFMITGMAIGGLTAGYVIKPGRERGPLIWVPILFAPVIVAIPHVSPIFVGPLLFLLTGIGFASMVPVSVALAQRLLPRNTGFASGLMLGGAWAFAMLGPPFAKILLENFGMKMSFALVAVALAISGFLIVPARRLNEY